MQSEVQKQTLQEIKAPSHPFLAWSPCYGSMLFPLPSPLSSGGCQTGGGLLIPATKPKNKYLEHISSALVSFQYEREGLKGIFCALLKAGGSSG